MDSYEQTAWDDRKGETEGHLLMENKLYLFIYVPGSQEPGIVPKGMACSWVG